MSVLGRFDRDEIARRLEAAGLLAAVAGRGFGDLEVEVAERGLGIPHIRLYGTRGGPRVLLVDACLSEASVRESFFRERGHAIDAPVELLVAYWVREQDPTRPFGPERPPLPLQEHPGLGVLPHAFAALCAMAVDLGRDGVAAVPKFFHDAWIFRHARLFRFLDAREQGRFERLAADLAALPLAHASLALLDGHVRDATGEPVVWAPGFQVCPLSPRLTAWFDSGEYANGVAAARDEARFHCAPLDLLPVPAAEPAAAAEAKETA